MKKHLPLLLLVLFNLTIGLLTLPGYGESMDELSQRSYADRTIQAVKSLVITRTMPAYFTEEEPKQGSHGPAFIMSVVLLKNILLPNGSSRENLYFYHILYFLMFQVGVISIYCLALRWVSQTAALGAALLFSTQPLLVGHAFINPKDVVFMSLCTASAVVGFWMIDRGENTCRPKGRSFVGGLGSFFSEFLCLDVWLAGLLLGFTSAIRIAAPLIGLMMLVYILLTQKRNLLPRLFAYGSIAFCFMVLCWPYLWPDPIHRLLASFLNSAQYPDLHLTLFEGTLVDSNALPHAYLPSLMLIQLTETTLLLIAVGIFAFFRKSRMDLVALIAVGFVLPITMIVLMDISLYNNFRQVFFTLPPLFILSGLGLDLLLSYFRRPAVHSAILFLAILPGLYANLTLYPYQYVYYNQLVGGLHGAYRAFELDYWNLAFKEAQLHVNRIAEKDANIYAGDSKSCAQTFARTDLLFNGLGCKKINWKNYDYIIVSTAQNGDLNFAKFPTIFVVERQGVPLAYVKEPSNGAGSSQPVE